MIGLHCHILLGIDYSLTTADALSELFYTAVIWRSTHILAILHNLFQGWDKEKKEVIKFLKSFLKIN